MKEKSNILHGPKYNFFYPEHITVGNLMCSQLEEHGNKIAQIQYETGKEHTFNEILIRSKKLAVYFRNNGVKVNDRIAICSENNLGWATAINASLFVGATVCPLNPGYSEREFLHTINISKPKFIFVSSLVLSNIRNYIKKLSWTINVILILEDQNINIPSIQKIIAKIPAKDIENFEVTKVNVYDHVVSILCSSGTTGLPKGVMITDKNYLCLMQTLLDESVNIIVKNQTVINLLPFFHSYCFSVLVFGLIAGSKAVVFSAFNEEAFLATIEKYRIQSLNLVPPLMVFLAKNPIVTKYDLSSVKTIWCGAAPLSREVEETVKRRLNNPVIKQAYGMTETTLSILKIPTDCYKPGSVGTLLPGISGKVIPIDDSGKWSDKTLGPYKEGELCFKGDLIMKGYCGDVKSTNATIDEDGWIHTGDVGYYDDDGFFYIVDRLKELIKYKGFQVPPAELEAILLTNPKIKDAAVVGLPDEIAGELPIAFIVTQQNAKITADDVVKYVNDRVSNSKKLRGGVRFMQAIPKNPSGKILRRELRQLLKSKL